MTATPATSFLPLTELWFHVLAALTDGPAHGYGLMRKIEQATGGLVSPAAGTMYLALARMEEDGLIAERKREGPPNPGRPRRSYGLTGLGRRVLRLEAERLAGQVQVAIEKHVLDSSALRTG